MAKKTKRTRKAMTEDNYDAIKNLVTVLKASGNKATSVEVARLTGYSDTTIWRLMNTSSYKEYQLLNSVSHKEQEQAAEKPVGDVGGVKPPEASKANQNIDTALTLERIATALENLVVAWEEGGKRKGILGR